MPHVVVLGSYPNEFLTHLQAAGYTHTEHNAYCESILNYEEPPVAVTVHGGDIELESTVILNILNAKAILLLFSPSTALLQVLKDTIESIVDLPKLQFEDNIPLIVHRMPGADHFHIIPGFSLGKPNFSSVPTDMVEIPESLLQHIESIDESPMPGDSRLLEYSIKLIGNCVSDAVNNVIAIEDKLNPPPETSFVKRDLLSFIKSSNSGIWDVYWVVDLYSYATEYTPIPNSRFKSNGGVVYTLVNHGGRAYISGGLTGEKYSASLALEYYHVRGESRSFFTNYLQTPEKWAHKTDDLYEYQINFSKSLNLFMNGGETKFPYTISYKDNYIRKGWEQIAVARDGSTSEFELHGSDSVQGERIFRGISMWTSDVGRSTLGMWKYLLKETFYDDIYSVCGRDSV